jgi:hypothetical protein
MQPSALDKKRGGNPAAFFIPALYDWSAHAGIADFL